MLNLKRQPARDEAALTTVLQWKMLTTVLQWKMLTTVEEVRTLLLLLGYHMELRFGHVDAVRESRSDLGQLIEDERHLFMVDALPMPCGSFLGYVQQAFQYPGYTIPTPGVRS
jgi:hypothetical protein